MGWGFLQKTRYERKKEDGRSRGRQRALLYFSRGTRPPALEQHMTASIRQGPLATTRSGKTRTDTMGWYQQREGRRDASTVVVASGRGGPARAVENVMVSGPMEGGNQFINGVQLLVIRWQLLNEEGVSKINKQKYHVYGVGCGG